MELHICNIHVNEVILATYIGSRVLGLQICTNPVSILAKSNGEAESITIQNHEGFQSYIQASSFRTILAITSVNDMSL